MSALPLLKTYGILQHLKHLEGSPARRARAGGNRADAVHPSVLFRAGLEVRGGSEIIRPRVDTLASIKAINDLLRAVAKALPMSACALNQRFYRALISSDFERARSNFLLKSHIASRISRKVTDVRALSACPKAKMLLFRRYLMIVGSETL
jgi:hypothetical protein